jgi:hypothetical protein
LSVKNPSGNGGVFLWKSRQRYGKIIKSIFGQAFSGNFTRQMYNPVNRVLSFFVNFTFVKIHSPIKHINMENNHDNSNNTRRPMLTGMFADRESTEKAYNTLHERGYTKDDINVVMSDETRKKHYSDKDDHSELGTKAAETAGTGSAIGGTIGAIAGVIAAIGTSVVIPGLGLIIAGPLAAGLAGAGAGGITGGLIGALVGSGIPEDRAKIYESGIKNGHVVVGVHPKNDEDAAFVEQNWKSTGGKDIYR